MTRRQKNFVDQYILNGGCAASAARAAGYSEKAAKVTGSKLLADGEVRSAIDARLSEIESSRVADEKELLEILTTIARGDCLILLGDCLFVISNFFLVLFFISRTLRIETAPCLREEKILFKGGISIS